MEKKKVRGSPAQAMVELFPYRLVVYPAPITAQTELCSTRNHPKFSTMFD